MRRLILFLSRIERHMEQTRETTTDTMLLLLHGQRRAGSERSRNYRPFQRFTMVQPVPQRLYRPVSRLVKRRSREPKCKATTDTTLLLSRGQRHARSKRSQNRRPI
jgi:hypothetical protein